MKASNYVGYGGSTLWVKRCWPFELLERATTLQSEKVRAHLSEDQCIAVLVGFRERFAFEVMFRVRC